MIACGDLQDGVKDEGTVARKDGICGEVRYATCVIEGTVLSGTLFLLQDVLAHCRFIPGEESYP